MNKKRTKQTVAPSTLFPKSTSRFRPSDKVRIKSGPYAGAEGVVQSTSLSSNGKRAMVKFRQLNGNVITAMDSELEYATAATRRELDRVVD